jgi:NAD(P)H-flavin reductase
MSGDPMVPTPYRLERTYRETADTFTLALSPVHEDHALSFRPGQFTMLYVFGVGEVPISISGDPARLPRLVQTVRSVGTVTQALCRLRRGDVVGVRGPYGTGWPIAGAAGNDVLVLAGGLGLAPLRPVFYTVLAHRERYGAVTLLYGARTPQDLLYAKELDLWRRHEGLTVEVTVDSSRRDWRGHVGVVTSLLAFVCGPEIMMRFTVMELLRNGVDKNDIVLSLERNMKCAVGFCGHCQFGPSFLCKDGPVFPYLRIEPFFGKREI